MDKLSYRVYYRDKTSRKKQDHKYRLLAAFVYEDDATFYVMNELNHQNPETLTLDYKIMQGNKNHKVYLS